MPIYKCINCNKVFKQKSHHTIILTGKPHVKNRTFTFSYGE